MSSKKRRRRHEEHEEHVDESWLVPYADILTLLLALFIVLFASSSLDKEKYNSVMDAIHQAFSGNSAIESGAGAGEGTGSGQQQADIEDILAALPKLEDNGEAVGTEDYTRQLDNLYRSVATYVDAMELEQTVSVEFKGEMVLVTLRNDIFFDSANAEITPEMDKQAKILANILQANQDAAHPFEVIVAGHTDNLPIESAKYPSNWYLSGYRALNFLGALLEGSNLDPVHFSARGYGEYDPVDTNDTPEGRQKNRRVELLITQNLKQESQNVSGTSE